MELRIYELFAGINQKGKGQKRIFLALLTHVRPRHLQSSPVSLPVRFLETQKIPRFSVCRFSHISH